MLRQKSSLNLTYLIIFQAFAATEQIESYTAIASGQLEELSTQQMTSCAPNPLSCGGDGGCSGSTPPLGYSYIQLFGAITEADYPYTSGTTMDTGSCEYDLASLSPVAAITGYDNLPVNDQDAIMNHIANVILIHYQHFLSWLYFNHLRLVPCPSQWLPATSRTTTEASLVV